MEFDSELVNKVRSFGYTIVATDKHQQGVDAMDKLSRLRPILRSLAKDKVDSLEYASAMVELRRMTEAWFL